jgi:hypothetical protein
MFGTGSISFRKPLKKKFKRGYLGVHGTSTSFRKPHKKKF